MIHIEVAEEPQAHGKAPRGPLSQLFGCFMWIIWITSLRTVEFPKPLNDLRAIQMKCLRCGSHVDHLDRADERSSRIHRSAPGRSHPRVPVRPLARPFVHPSWRMMAPTDRESLEVKCSFLSPITSSISRSVVTKLVS